MVNDQKDPKRTDSDEPKERIRQIFLPLAFPSFIFVFSSSISINLHPISAQIVTNGPMDWALAELACPRMQRKF